jgi:acetyl esterase/lipase
MTSTPAAARATTVTLPAIPLHTGGVPGMPAQAEFATPDGRVLRNVASASLTPVLPAPGTANGCAVLVLPGGGFRVLAVELEGQRVAQALAERGFTALVLQYRLLPTPADPQAFGREMQAFLAAAAGGEAPPDLAAPASAVADVAAALALVRAQAAQWGVDPARVGLMGFSAGAMAATAHVLQAPAAQMPAFLVNGYGPLLASPAPLPAHVPPLYALMAADDPLFAKRGFGLVGQWIAAQRPVELHLLQAGGHGFGLGRAGTTTQGWLDGLTAWLRCNGWVAA